MKYLKKFKTDADYSVKRKNEYEEPWVSLTVAKGGDVESFKGLFIETGEESRYDFFYENNSFIYATNLSECQITSVVYDGDSVSSFTTNENDVFQNGGGMLWGCENNVIVGDYEVENIEILADLGGLSAATVNSELYANLPGSDTWLGIDLEQMIETGKVFVHDGPVAVGDIVTIFMPETKKTYLTEEEIVVGKNIKVAVGDNQLQSVFPNKVLGVGQMDNSNETRVIEILESETGETLNKVDYNKTERERLAEMPLTFDIICGGTLNWFGGRYNTSSTHTNLKSINYSINGGAEMSIMSNATTGVNINVNTGDVVRLWGNNTGGYAKSGNYGSVFYNQFSSASTAVFTAKGNIMSLVYGKNFEDKVLFENNYMFYNFFNTSGLTDASKVILPATALTFYCYYHMFSGCTSLTKAPVLPAETLASSCYAGMFDGCTSLTKAPTLPATTLENSCYNGMFNGCTGLTQAPELPATTLAPNCYSSMFNSCTSLTKAPTLPATTLVDNCYIGMFNGCTSLTQAPELPATTLALSCYSNMFRDCWGLLKGPSSIGNSDTVMPVSACTGMFNGCRSLTKAPELPAETLANYCYYEMFSGCTNLNYIKCLATNISASNSHTNWVSRVQTTSGTFVKASSMTDWPSGASGIPNNWTVVDA